MDNYSPAADSQAAYAAMPNQGLDGINGPTAGGPSYGLTQAQRQQLAAQLLLKGFQQPQQGGMAAPAALPSMPAQTPQAGQFVAGGR